MTSALLPPSPALADARRVLRDTFGYPEFRPGQPDVIADVLARRDTLAVMPTGAGKSICYQVPALLFDHGVTIVVSPLLALMKDQVDALNQAGVAASAINSSLSRDEQLALLRRVGAGEVRILYVAPERFGDGAFRAALRGLPVALLAIDEAHCISAWGHDFRPAYRELGGARALFGSPPIVALTATADPLVREDIVQRLGLRDAAVHVAGFDRPNLRFDVARVRTQKDKLPIIAERLKAIGPGESAIVYCATRKKTEDVTDGLQRAGIRSARYHAGMEDADRRRIQDAFARDSLRVIVATNAFGMGIDKPDVRAVIHHDLPESLESYYQEAGRAGRDGGPADCLLLFAPRDRRLREFFIEQSHPAPDMVLDVYRALGSHQGERIHVREVMTSDDEPGVNAAIQALVESGLAGRRGYQVWATRPDGESDIDLEGLEAHRAHAVSKLDAMQAYAESMTCLRARILDYFGDQGHPSACGNCGPCLAPPVMLRDAEAPRDEDLFQQLRGLRRRLAEEADLPPYVIFSDATLREMASAKPRTQSEMLAVTGVGQAKWQKYGQAFLAITRAAAAADAPATAPDRDQPVRQPIVRSRDGTVVSPSIHRTYLYLREGLTIQQIADRRGFTPSTISQHIATLVSHGDIDDISPWVDDVLLARIRKAAGGGRIGPIGPVREALDGAVTYEQLHIARALINRSTSP